MPTPPPPLSATAEEELELMPKCTEELSFSSSIKAEKSMSHGPPPNLTSTRCKHRVNRALYSVPWTLLILALLAVTSVRAGEGVPSVRTEELDEDQKLQVAFSNTTANGVRREGIDTALRKYAFMALAHARTGVIYNVSLPPFLDGIICQAMRVRSGSARRRGLTFNEFTLPQGLVVVTGGPFVIMVYRKIVNFTVYSLPEGYSFVGPVVGIVIYTNTNTSFDDEPLPEMNVVLPNASITARPPISKGLPPNSTPTCAFFDINGTVSFDNVSSVPNNCSSTSLMDVGLVLPSSLLPPSPSYSPSPASLGMEPPAFSQRSGSNVWKIALLAVIGGLVGLALMTAIVVLGFRVKDECNASRVEEPTDDDETLQTSLIGHTRAPTAAGVRTKPSLETGSLHT